MEAQLEVDSGCQLSPSVWPHNAVTAFRPPSATVVSAEPFSQGTGTLRCLQKETATYRHWSVSLWRDPDDVPHYRMLYRQNWMAAYLATLCGWRRCFQAHQLQFMRCIRKEVVSSKCLSRIVSVSFQINMDGDQSTALSNSSLIRK